MAEFLLVYLQDLLNVTSHRRKSDPLKIKFQHDAIELDADSSFILSLLPIESHYVYGRGWYQQEFESRIFLYRVLSDSCKKETQDLKIIFLKTASNWTTSLLIFSDWDLSMLT